MQPDNGATLEHHTSPLTIIYLSARLWPGDTKLEDKRLF